MPDGTGSIALDEEVVELPDAQDDGADEVVYDTDAPGMYEDVE